MRDPALHLRSLSDSLDNLESFLHADQAFWSRGNLPSLSLGGVHWDRLVLTAARPQLAPAARKRFDRLAAEIERIAGRWRVAWERKAAGEARARLNLWRSYLSELAERPGEAQHYPQEVRNRLLAGYLIEQAGGQPEAGPLVSQLQALDARLSAGFRSGEFVWEAELASELPRASYWYLYGRPSAPG